MKKEAECIRCGTSPLVTLNMGKLGNVPLCIVCWAGLAACMSKDYEIFQNNSVDFIDTLKKADLFNFGSTLPKVQRINE